MWKKSPPGGPKPSFFRSAGAIREAGRRDANRPYSVAIGQVVYDALIPDDPKVGLGLRAQNLPLPVSMAREGESVKRCHSPTWISGK